MRMPARRNWLFLALVGGLWIAVCGPDYVLAEDAGSPPGGDQPVAEGTEGAAEGFFPIPGLLDMPPAAAEPMTWETFLKPWEDFGELPVLTGLLVVFLMAAALGAVIAYHPRSYGKARSLSDIESPKTYIIYALVGAVVGQIVKIEPALGFAIFGIGGLMRFRTDVGAAKDTGRVILVTCVGLCCGLFRYDIAIISTVFAYGLISALEGGTAYKIIVKGLSEETLMKSAEAYRELLENEGCRILNEKKHFAKHQARFVFRAPRGIDREDLEQLFDEEIPSDLKGAPEWQSS